MDDDNSSESGDDVIPPVNIRDKESNINSVDHGFIKSGKSTGDGVLHTHNKSFRYYKRNSNNKNDLVWYDCACRKTTGCKATACVEILYSEDEQGEMIRTARLKSVSTPEVHGLFHEPERSAIIVKEIMTKTREAVEADVNCKVGKLSDCELWLCTEA